MPAAADNLAPPFVIAGVDEVGRGPLAGPVVAAAVILDPARPVDGLDDSKRLGEPERERLDALIRHRALAWCVASASVAEIDSLNILHASLLAMQRAVAGLVPPGGRSARPVADGGAGAVRRAAGGHEAVAGAGIGTKIAAGATPGNRRTSAPGDLSDPAGGRPGAPGAGPSLVLVDGNRCPVLPFPCAAIVRGDGRVRAIAAASIVAKVARDTLMRRWHEHHPEFGFAAHKGYATKAHREALGRLGATPLHRRSFAPVRAALAATAGRPTVSRSAPSRTSPTPSADESPSPNEP